jgi:hypothetical protein
MSTAKWIVAYRRSGRLYLDGLSEETADAARENFMRTTRALGWHVTDVELHPRDYVVQVVDLGLGHAGRYLNGDDVTERVHVSAERRAKASRAPANQQLSRQAGDVAAPAAVRPRRCVARAAAQGTGGGHAAGKNAEPFLVAGPV